MDQVRKFRRIFWICAMAALAAAGAVFWRLNGAAGLGGSGHVPALDVLMVVIGIGAVFVYIWLVIEYRILRPLQGLEADLRAAKSGHPIDPREGSLVEPVARAADALIRNQTGAGHDR